MISASANLWKIDLQYNHAQQALAECRTAMEAKQIADIAEAARVYLERTNASVETVNRATEIRTLAERQMGEFLAAMPKAMGTKNQLVSRGVIGGNSSLPPITQPTLAEIGITKMQSSRAQKLAAIPADEFKERIAVAKASGGRLATAAEAECLAANGPRGLRARQIPLLAVVVVLQTSADFSANAAEFWGEVCGCFAAAAYSEKGWWR